MKSDNKLQVYLLSPLRSQSPRLKAGPRSDPTTQALAKMMDTVAQTENELSGDSGLHFNMLELAFLLRVKLAATELNCEYEFIDVNSGKTFDLDQSTLMGILLTGKRELDKFEKKLPKPCLRVGKSYLQFNFGSEPTFDEIKQFYLDKAGSK